MEDTSEEQLTKAMAIYRDRYGSGEVILVELEEIIREIKPKKKRRKKNVRRTTK